MSSRILYVDQNKFPEGPYFSALKEIGGEYDHIQSSTRAREKIMEEGKFDGVILNGLDKYGILMLHLTKTINLPSMVVLNENDMNTEKKVKGLASIVATGRVVDDFREFLERVHNYSSIHNQKPLLDQK